MLKGLVRLALILGGFALLPVCAMGLLNQPRYRAWQEEVKLNDGRVIVVAQKRRCEAAYTGHDFASCISRETWLRIKLPEFGSEEIVWNERLDPMLVNIDKGKLYVVGRPPTGREFNLYGRPQPPYLGYRWIGEKWEAISFRDIPDAIYDTNMVIDLPPEETRFLTLVRKNGSEMNGSREYPKFVERIDPSHKSNFH
jgi:hypothetical protein